MKFSGWIQGAAVLAGVGCSPDKTADGPLDETGLDSEMAESFDDAALRRAIEADMVALDVSAMAVAVLRNGETVWVEGFGTLTPDGTEPVDGDSRFRVASVTKSMTAVAVLQQVDAGCLALSDAITDHMPFEMQQQPGMADGMQVAHTLNMTAGLYDVEAQTGQDGDGFIERFTAEMQRSLVLLAPPGRMYNYTNPSSVLAGRLVEICVDDFYRPYMDASVLGPLGLDRTTFDTDTVVSDGQYVSGVSKTWEGAMGADTVLDAESYAASHLWPAMGAWSSARDIARLAEFWMAGDPTVLPDALHAQMVTKQVDREEGFPDAGYGFGLKIKTGIELGDAHYPVRMVSHGGTIFGYTAHVYTVPELGVGVVALLNREMVTPTETLAAGLDLAARVDATASETAAPDPATFAELAGTYTHDIVMGDFIFTVEDGHLMVDIPSLDGAGLSYDRRLTAVRPDNFHLQIDGTVQLLSFLRGADGRPEYVRNRYYVGERVDGALVPRTRPVPEAWRTGGWVLPDFGG